jgi:hypothetical protein
LGQSKWLRRADNEQISSERSNIQQDPAKKQKPMTGDERTAWQARKNAKLTETKSIVVNSRGILTLLRNDPKALLREWGLLKND